MGRTCGRRRELLHVRLERLKLHRVARLRHLSMRVRGHVLCAQLRLRGLDLLLHVRRVLQTLDGALVERRVIALPQVALRRRCAVVAVLLRATIVAARRGTRRVAVARQAAAPALLHAIVGVLGLHDFNHACVNVSVEINITIRQGALCYERAHSRCFTKSQTCPMNYKRLL